MIIGGLHNPFIRPAWGDNPSPYNDSDYVRIIGLESVNENLGGGSKHFLFSPLLVEDSHFD